MTPFNTWRKSSYSDPENADCVELAHSRQTVAIRDSKNPAGDRLTFPLASLSTLLRSVK